MKRGGTYGNKLKVPNFPMSEASFLIWSLDQREDWATIVCLVDGGQEINTGEAGISEWIKSLNETFTHWKVYISPKLTEAEYAEENAVHWFLEDKADTRASNYLEDAATEIQVQGLELDYTCLLWDADMRYENGL